MSAKLSKSERCDVSAAIQNRLQNYAYQTWPSANQKARIWKLSRLLKWPERRTRALYYNEQGSRVRAEEVADAEQLQTHEAKNELSELRQRIARLETALAVRDAAYHSADIDALRQQMRGFGGMDSTGNQGD